MKSSPESNLHGMEADVCDIDELRAEVNAQKEYKKRLIKEASRRYIAREKAKDSEGFTRRRAEAKKRFLKKKGPEYWRAANKRSYEKHKEKVIAYQVARNRERYKNDPEYKARKDAYAVKRANNNKLKLIAFFGGRCSDCKGSFHPSAYDFHHLDPSKKDGLLKLDRSWERVLKDTEGCILLCSNCHRARHYKKE